MLEIAHFCSTLYLNAKRRLEEQKKIKIKIKLEEGKNYKVIYKQTQFFAAAFSNKHTL